MALQGDLDSFALPDVLRLLAGTAKTGRLDVSGDDATGSVSLDGGTLVGGSVSSAPHAITAPDVVFELLRFKRGSFLFDDAAGPEASGDPSSVDDAISQAERLLQEWDEVSSVVTSVHSWVAITPDLPGEEITINAEQWRVLSALGAGATVRDIANHFSLTDLVASRQVKGLVETGLVELASEPTASIATEAPPGPRGDVDTDTDEFEEYTSFDRFEEDEHDHGIADARPPSGNRGFLDAEDGPVVLEASDDALLPEPLPVESTSYEGDLSDLGSVDSYNSGESEGHSEYGSDFGSDSGSGEFGRSYDPEYDAADAELVTPSDPNDPLVDPFSRAWDDPVAAHAEAQSTVADSDLNDRLQDEERAWSAFTSGDTMVDHLAEAEGQPSHAEEDVEEGPTDTPEPPQGDGGDRGSLLKFLSTVKP